LLHAALGAVNIEVVHHRCSKARPSDERLEVPVAGRSAAARAQPVRLEGEKEAGTAEEMVTCAVAESAGILGHRLKAHGTFEVGGRICGVYNRAVL
jgi:hypothetical protein